MSSARPARGSTSRPVIGAFSRVSQRGASSIRGVEDEERHDVAGLARLDPFDITARARGSHGEDGCLALPRTAHWPIFPFVTEGLRVQALEDPVLSEPPRRDVTAEECETCRRSDQDFVWTDERWLVSMSTDPESLPGAVLPRAHLDFPDLTEELGGELACCSCASSGRWRLSKGLGACTSTNGVTVAPTCMCSSWLGRGG